ncbi:hypothetical protein C7Y66_07870 [Chroococcidiopsis sp. CCALA 051]|nr:hypothetical protein C7Y66_07870 [Chroococcidiopsis sp. CCALA 051]
MDCSMLRKFTILFLTLTLCWTTVACGGPNEANNPQATRNVATRENVSTQLADGEYPVQQAEYNDVDGTYSLVLLNTPPGTPPVYNTQNLQMARLTDEQIKAGQKSYLKVENGQPALYLTEDFRIQYVHNVTETQTNPQTGQQEAVVVRRETSFWTPFAGALAGNIAGQAIGSLLFRPQYYVPPVYQPGVSVLRGYGGYGNTYDRAVSSYRTRYNAAPAAVRNRQTFRTTGRIRTPSGSTVRTPARTTNRPTGSGYGTNILRPSGNRNSTYRRPSSGSFGSGSRSRGSFGSGSRSRSSFGSRRR